MLGFRGGAMTWPVMGFGQAAVAGIDQAGHIGVGVEEVVDAFGLDRGLVMHAARPDRAAPQRD